MDPSRHELDLAIPAESSPQPEHTSATPTMPFPPHSQAVSSSSSGTDTYPPSTAGQRPLPTNFPVTPSPPYRLHDATPSLRAAGKRPAREDASYPMTETNSMLRPSGLDEPSSSEKQLPRFDPDLPGLGYTTDDLHDSRRRQPAVVEYRRSSPSEKRIPRFDPDLPGLGYIVDEPAVPANSASGHRQQYSLSERYAGADPVIGRGMDEPFDPSYLAPAGHMRTHSSGSLQDQEYSGSTSVHSSSSYAPVLQQQASGDAGPSYHAGMSRGPSDVQYERPREDRQDMDVTFNVRVNAPRVDSGYVLSKERIASLSEVDSAKFGWFHMKICLIAGVGFFTDAYDIFSINIASSMLQFVYVPNPGLPGGMGGAIKAAAPVGTLLGQLIFGYLGDHVGRKRMYGIELIIIIIGTFGQALSSNGDIGTINIYAVLVVWRLIMGLGIGGDYPLSAVIASEFASTHIRGRMVTAVFANQGWGQFAASLIGLILTSAYGSAFKNASTTSPTDLELRRDIDQCWRILIGLGCVPAAIALWFRLTIPETPRFTMDIERNVKQATQDIDRFLNTGRYKFDPDSIVVRVLAPRATVRDFMTYFGRWDNLRILVGCAYSWFAIDVVFYGLGLNTDTFFNDLGFDPTNFGDQTTAKDIFSDFKNLCIANMLLSAVGLIPGYWATFLLVDVEYIWFKNIRLGRKSIQLVGFAVLTILFIAMGASYHHLIPNPGTKASSLFDISHGAKVFLFLFILSSFFQNFGPNTTSFIIPGEAFPTRYRSTCHGLCAASGKIGAIIAQFAFQKAPARTVLLSYVPFTITGFLATLLIDETNQMTLEDISNEEQENFISGPVRPPASDIAALRNHYLSTDNQ